MTRSFVQSGQRADASFLTLLSSSIVSFSLLPSDNSMEARLLKFWGFQSLSSLLCRCVKREREAWPSRDGAGRHSRFQAAAVFLKQSNQMVKGNYTKVSTPPKRFAWAERKSDNHVILNGLRTKRRPLPHLCSRTNKTIISNLTDKSKKRSLNSVFHLSLRIEEAIG
ncbi:hypothetical protein GE09DRAFT_129619 [Coniochaeta sp. 2T2.1]|nr:hypothetical protein GE09DRAFT_129619 [Coniochaeta sp. 2T2.1]